MKENHSGVLDTFLPKVTVRFPSGGKSVFVDCNGGNIEAKELLLLLLIVSRIENEKKDYLNTISSSRPFVGNTITMAGFRGNFLFNRAQGGDNFSRALSRRMYP